MQYMKRTLGRATIAALAGITLQQAAASANQDFDCLIEPHSVVEVSTRETGVLGSLLVERGDSIKQGQPLARLESGVETVALEIARARARMGSAVEAKEAESRYLKAQQVRIDELYAKKAIPLHEKEKAATEAAKASAELKEARENLALAQLDKQRAEEILDRRTIRSLINGVVVNVLIDPGELVDERPIMTIAEVNPLNVEVVLPATLYGRIRVGSHAEVHPRIEGLPSRESAVVVVDKVIDAASNTFGVRLELDNSDYAIPGGIRCDIDFPDLDLRQSALETP